MDIKLFINQTESDGVLDDVSTMIGSTRSNLHVVVSDKGLVVRQISFFEDGDFIDCMSYSEDTLFKFLFNLSFIEKS